jgi:uncharacterized protein
VDRAFELHGRRYRSFGAWLRHYFGETVQKVCIDAGLTCPNRDGSKSRGGCLFCSAGGSGAGHVLTGLEIADQVRTQIARSLKRKGARRFIAYFQSFSNTYAPLEQLRELYDAALCDERIVGLSVATRGDCVCADTVDLLAEYRQRVHVWLELGLETSSQATLDRMNRSETVEDFVRASALARTAGIDVVAHCIFGLPGDTRADAMRSIDLVNQAGASGVKIHNLYVDRTSGLAEQWRLGRVPVLSLEDYVELACDALERLRPDILIHRLTGEAPSGDLLAPDWVRDKASVLRAIEAGMESRGTFQGARYLPAV